MKTAKVVNSLLAVNRDQKPYIKPIMKIEKHFFRISIKDIIYIFLATFLAINIITVGFTFVQEELRFFLHAASWPIQILLPIIIAIIFGVANRDGVMKITNTPDYTYTINKIELLLEKRGLGKTVIEPGLISYTKRSRLGSLFFSIFREDVSIRISDDEILIYGKRNTFSAIYTNIRFDKKLNPKF